MKILPIFFNIIIFKISWTLADMKTNANLTDFLKHRQKRGLIFQGGGILKFVIGPALPIDLADPVGWRSLICAYNLHGGQYTVPTTPLYPWDKWEDTFARSLKQMRHRFDHFGDYHEDGSRLFMYTGLEKFMDAQKIDGRVCLLRLICENAQMDQHIGVITEILNVILTPGKEKLNPVYKEAREAGKSGVNCLKTYASCPMGANIFDQFIHEL